MIPSPLLLQPSLLNEGTGEEAGTFFAAKKGANYHDGRLSLHQSISGEDAHMCVNYLECLLVRSFREPDCIMKSPKITFASKMKSIS